MTALFILIILAAGYLAVVKHPYMRYRLHRFEGQQLYLLAIYWGVKCLFVSLTLYFSLTYLSERANLEWLGFFSDFEKWIVSTLTKQGPFIDSHSEAMELAWIISLTVLSWLSAYLLKILGHVGLKRKYGRWTADSSVIAAILADSPLDKLIVKSFFCTDKNHEDFLLMLTMDDHKVYVGKVIDCGEPSETDGIDQEILVTPMLSGYRNKEHKVTFTTYYTVVGRIIPLVLPQDRIRAATPFSEIAYCQFQMLNNEGGQRGSTRKIEMALPLGV